MVQEGSDPRVLVALTNGPEYGIVQWNFEKNKFVCNVIDKLDKPESNKLEKDNGAAGEKYTELFFFKEEDFHPTHRSRYHQDLQVSQR